MLEADMSHADLPQADTAEADHPSSRAKVAT